MFNIPWYSWFNVLALPLLMGMMYIDMSVEGKPAWLKKFLGFHALASVICIFLYWNSQLVETLVPLSYLLAAIVIPFSMWNLAQGTVDLLKAIYVFLVTKSCTERTTLTRNVTTRDANVLDVDILSDDLDLDAGNTCRSMDEDARAIGAAISSLVSHESSARQRMDSMMSLLGEDDDTVSTSIYANLVALLFYAVISLPPVYMSLRLLSPNGDF